MLNIFEKGVIVNRDTEDYTGGVKWRVTFLDDNMDISLTVSENAVVSSSINGIVNVTTDLIVSGVDYGDCTVTKNVPKEKELTIGQLYYARVFAINEVGFSLAEMSPSSQKPMVIPGAPTSVALSVVNSTSLMVSFNPPASDGGDVITQYKVEFSTSGDFADMNSVILSYVSDGAPFHQTINDLEPGIFYFVRVRAMNRQGYSDPTICTPSKLNPHTTSEVPSNFAAYVTSDTMITVQFNAPDDNGGDSISSYRVEWDISSRFDSISAAPHKGYLDVSAAKYTSYTIQYLTTSQRYYVRVAAINSKGVGKFVSSGALVPTLEIPGKPHSVLAVPGSNSGEILVTWQYPRVPWHNVPCFGTNVQPFDCPTAIGGEAPSSTGGSSITEYAISYSDYSDFTGVDSGEIVTQYTHYTLQNLTPGRLYYIRVLARNAQGSGLYCAFTDYNCLVVTTRTSAISK